MLLALDTSTRSAGIALYDAAAGILAERQWHSAHQHTVELLPEVAQLLAQAGVTVARLTGLAVALGPGSFTGLRVALAAAKGLALAQKLPVIGVPTLEVMAYPCQYQPRPAVVALQAGRGRLCWAVYEHGAQGWAAAGPYALTTAAAMAARAGQAAAGPLLFAGELSAGDRAAIESELGSRALCLPPAVGLRRAGYLAELASPRLAAGQTDDVDSLSPIYLQEPAAPKEG